MSWEGHEVSALSFMMLCAPGVAPSDMLFGACLVS